MTNKLQKGNTSLLALLLVLLFVVAFAVSSYLGLWDRVLPSLGLKQNLQQHISPNTTKPTANQTVDELNIELNSINIEDLETDFKEVDTDITNL